VQRRLPVAGFLLLAAGFSVWAMRAAAFGEPVYLWMNVIRVASALLAVGGIVAMSRGGSTRWFRYGIHGFLAAAVIALVYNLTQAITLPEDLSTLFGFAGAVLASYGAAHWYEPQGDALSAWLVAVGAGLMACNPGLYFVLGLARGDFWQEGWGFGSLLASAGLGLVAATVSRLSLRVPATALRHRKPGRLGAP